MKPAPKDNALDAMKRAARAVLKEELRALRAELKTAKAEAATVTADCTLKLHENNQRVFRLERERDQALGNVASYRQRIDKVAAWGRDNRSGDIGFRCCAEYLQAGPTPLTYGAGGLYVNPFDRWQVTPAIR